MATTPGWIRQFHKPRAVTDPPLVICPHAGGGASTYRPFSQRLREHFDVAVLQYPGRQDRSGEAPLSTLSEIAAGAFDEFARSRFRRDQPLTVFGHSMGAIVAFEFTRLAESAGVPVRLLGISGAVAPARVVEMPDHPTDDEQLLDHVAGMQGTGDEVLGNRELMRMALPVLKADYAAFDRYSCASEERVWAPIHAMGGSDDEFVTVGELYGWQRHTAADLQVSMFDGGHFYLHDEVAEISELLYAELETTV